jgi:hypothetical protein
LGDNWIDRRRLRLIGRWFPGAKVSERKPGSSDTGGIRGMWKDEAFVHAIIDEPFDVSRQFVEHHHRSVKKFSKLGSGRKSTLVAKSGRVSVAIAWALKR